MKKSYESSKWYIKIIRNLWYIYAFALFIIYTIEPTMVIDYLIISDIDEQTKNKIKYNWKLIKKHVELSKMNKYSSKI